MTAGESPPLPPFLRGGGRLGELIGAFDWSRTALGPLDGWPPHVRAATSLMLRSVVPIVMLWGEPGVMIYNDAYSLFAGGRHPQLLGSNVREAWGEVADFNDNVMRVGLAGGTLSYRDQELTLYRHGQAEQVWMNLDYSPLLDDAGVPAGVMAVVVETTAKVLAERRLSGERQRLAQLFEQAPGIMALLSGPAHRFELANPSYQRLVGSQRPLLGLPVAEALPEAESQGYVALLNRVYQTGQAYTAHGAPFDVQRVPGAAPEMRYVDFVFQPIRGEDGGVQGVFIEGADVTVRVAAEQRREAMEARLREANESLEEKVQARTRELIEVEAKFRQAQKMEAIGQLTGGIAHDFNNMLGTMSTSLQVLQKRLQAGQAEGSERYIGMAQQSVRRAAALTQRLLAFSRQQTLDPRPTDVNRLIAGLEEMIRRSIGPAVELEVVGAGGLWATRVDAPQLENALLNLCINARDAMPEGGRLTIETANSWLDGHAAAERELPPGQYVSISVTDTGTGMTEEVIARAFDPFFTTKPVGAGTGLGLSMVYGFVRQSGGQVRVYSELGVGTTMSLYLPRHFGSADREASSRDAGPADGSDGEGVLLVEDEESIRLLVTEELESLGYRVTAVGDGQAALAVLGSPARIDLLITDVGLPGGLNGRQVADAGRSQRPGLKVLFVTGYAQNAAVGNGLLEPGMEVVTKPFDLVVLAARIREMLERPARL